MEIRQIKGHNSEDQGTLRIEVNGTEKISAMLHTLRPERFGGESDGDTVHLVSSDVKPPAFNTTVESFGLWHASFDLPVNE